MNHKEQQSDKSIRNWLGLGALALLVIGLIRLSGSAQPTAEAEDTAAPSITTLELTSPLPAEILSPLSSPLDSPLPTTMSASGSQADTAPVDSFRLTVLHTNDTWGYLLPCG
jgi:hypothetical protein